MQQSSAATLSNALRVYEGGDEAAIALLRAGDEETYAGLLTAFGAHSAPLVSLERSTPDGLPVSGNCIIRESGVTVTVMGAGASLMGMQMEANWGEVSDAWRNAAEFTGTVWLGLMTEDAYQRMLYANAVEAGDMRVFLPVLPEMPVIRLEALFP